MDQPADPRDAEVADLKQRLDVVERKVNDLHDIFFSSKRYCRVPTAQEILSGASVEGYLNDTTDPSGGECNEG